MKKKFKIKTIKTLLKKGLTNNIRSKRRKYTQTKKKLNEKKL